MPSRNSGRPGFIAVSVEEGDLDVLPAPGPVLIPEGFAGAVDDADPEPVFSHHQPHTFAGDLEVHVIGLVIGLELLSLGGGVAREHSQGDDRQTAERHGGTSQGARLLVYPYSQAAHQLESGDDLLAKGPNCCSAPNAHRRCAWTPSCPV